MSNKFLWQVNWAWDKENDMSTPTGLEPMTSQHREGALSTELWELMENKVI